MPYTINKYNGAVVATVADGTIDSIPPKITNC